MSAHSPAEFGAALDGLTNDRHALQQAIDTAHREGGGTVIIPAGRVLATGSITLKSRVALHLEPGSRLVASPDPYDYRGAVLIETFHAADVAITGTGEIDGRGASFMAREFSHVFEPQMWRPRLMCFENCSRVRLLNVTVRDSAEHAIVLAGCDDVVVRGVSVLNNMKVPASDGIVADHSRNLRLSECLIESGGDCIVLAASSRYPRHGSCENVLVRDCILATSSAALSVGPDTVNDVRNVVFSDSVIRQCHRGLAIFLRDAGTVENIFAHNLAIESQLHEPNWRGASEPVFVSALPRVEHDPVGRIRRLRVADIVAQSEGGVFVEGSPASVIEDVRFENVTLEISKKSRWPSRRDVRPPDERGPEEAVTAGFHIRDADRVVIRDCAVHWGPDCPDCYGPALRTERVEHLRVEHFDGHDAHFGEKRRIVA